MLVYILLAILICDFLVFFEEIAFTKESTDAHLCDAGCQEFEDKPEKSNVPLTSNYSLLGETTSECIPKKFNNSTSHIYRRV